MAVQSARRALHTSAEQKPVMVIEEGEEEGSVQEQGRFSSTSPSATQAVLNRASLLPCPCTSENYQFMLFMCLSWMLFCCMLLSVPLCCGPKSVVQKRAVLFLDLHISCSPLLFP
jgi:hypothetical protein